MSSKFELNTSGDKFRWNLKASNGQVILTSQSYASKSGAKNGIESVRTNASVDSNFERKTAKDGSPFFVLLASNKQVIGNSQMYKSTTAMENGIASVAKNAAGAEVVDNT